MIAKNVSVNSIIALLKETVVVVALFRSPQRKHVYFTFLLFCFEFIVTDYTSED